ncbi:hypothetical protein GO730_00415 [Spirosoma sp. HMF3257]|uniref:HK97 gp10 family phage protein n=1 Tax=Spirosoma telluris TaxID=2183553 RepID=A0A327NDL9_9BACT|nr:hypothetical protein [Spirosoma telluris]RAI73267.1 hypothetical protein HMF3257_00405 [Spirosoma telluris]
MANSVQLTQEQFERIATDVVGGVVAEALLVMQAKLRQADYVLTGELLDSLRHQAVVVGRDMYAEFSIGFAGYGRFKDMRQLLYNKMPPIDILEQFVREVGLDKFGYIPGYIKDAKRRVTITDSRAVNRIAWGIAVNRLRLGARRGSAKNAFYNPVRGKLIYETSYKLLESMPEPILRGMKEYFKSAY